MLKKPSPHSRRSNEGFQVRTWHALSVEEVTAHFSVDMLLGLSEGEARERLTQFGPNSLRKEKHEPIWEIFLEEIRQPLILLLLLTGVLYALWGELIDTLTIIGVILAVVGVEVVNEHRAEKAVAALRKLAEPTALVRRGGHSREIPTEDIVPGDVVLLRSGQRAPADARLIEAYGLAADESSLTGESVPTEKEAHPRLPEDTPLAERRNLVFAGTTIARGRCTALVVATGMATELGRVAQLAREVKEPRTPLQQTMRELARWMVLLALGFSVLVPLLGWLLADRPLEEMILTGLSLAFATIPEELPILVTIVLALGAYRLSQRRAIVKRLRSAETLSAVTVIATDKTGTLTENRMQVSQLYPDASRLKLLEMGVLCNDAMESRNGFAGDPLETALLRAAQETGLDVNSLRHTHPLRNEFTFDNTRKRMSVVCERDSILWIVVKGAPEAVLSCCSHQWTGESASALTQDHRQGILATAAEMAGQGLRVIAFAEKTVPDGRLALDEVESQLTFAGLVGLADPPRSEVKEAVAAARGAGIRLTMVTGDHPLTARSIANQVGLNENTRVLAGTELDTLSDEALGEAVGQGVIYVRTTPEHKLRIVRALRQRGEVVAVTGDGINDAPALAAADIGVAMGETGSEVAREAADMVLADDNFATIVHAVEEGRRLFANLKKAIRYYLACKVALILTTLLPVLLLVPVPFLPIQIILMELFMDLAAAATFVSERPESDLMRRPPRDQKAPFLDFAMVTSIFSSALGLFAAVSVAYLVTWYSGGELERARTMAFVTWLLGHVLLALNLRSERESLFRLGLFSNRLMLIWAAATLAFVLIATLVPGLQEALKTTALSGRDWALAVGVALAGTFWIEAGKWLSHFKASYAPKPTL